MTADTFLVTVGVTTQRQYTYEVQAYTPQEAEFSLIDPLDRGYAPDALEGLAEVSKPEQMEHFIVDTVRLEKPAATYHGIVKVECLICGHVETTVALMEAWNDYGVVCIRNHHKGGATRWWMQDGTVQLTVQDAEGNLVATHTIKEADS